MSSAPVEKTVFVHDGNQIVSQFDETGTTGALDAADQSHRYLWNPQAVDHLFADEQIDGALTDDDTLWALTDHLGSVRDLAQYDSTGDGTTSVVNHRVFDSYGNLESEINPQTGLDPTVDSIFGYTGRLFDEATGLQNNLNRWYDATIGRWLSEDPVGFVTGDANLYRYVGNSVANYTDPYGLKKFVPFKNYKPKYTLGDGAGCFAKNWWGGKWIWDSAVGIYDTVVGTGEDIGNATQAAKGAELDRQRRQGNINRINGDDKLFQEQRRSDWREATEETAWAAKKGIPLELTAGGSRFSHVRPQQPGRVPKKVTTGKPPRCKKGIKNAPEVAASDRVPAVPVTSKQNPVQLRGMYRGRMINVEANKINVRTGNPNVTGSGLEYAWKGHGGTGANSKSQFTITRSELKEILQRKDVIKSPIQQSGTTGNYIRQVDVGKKIGNIPASKGGDPTSVITVITDVKGNLMNTFPGTLGRKATL